MKTQKKYEDLFFTDDFIFCKIMSTNESICKRVIKVLLGIEVEKLIYLNTQEESRPTYSAHGIRLDVIAKDTGKVYDIEMQTSVKENLALRSRYYQAAMDVDLLEKNKPYSALPDSYIVFICMEDPFGGGLPRYTTKLSCKENPALDEKINDKTQKIYYNANEWDKLADEDAEVRAFLKFLATQKPENPLAEDIMEQVMYIRGQEPWRVEFMQERERKQEAYNDGLADGLEQGRAEAKEQLAADQAEIAKLKARIAELEAAGNKN